MLRDAGLDPKLYAFGTKVEWVGAVMSALRRCHDTVHQLGAPRVSTTMKLSTRVNREQSLDDKMRSVKRQS